jgi:glycosyltransferase involved in cell wall biosynthesis
MSAPLISAYVIAFNEEQKVAETLKTLQWVDDLVLVDSYSKDRTAKIAESMGARVIQVEFQGFGHLRNQAIEACRGDWIFSLDSDERCTSEVRDEILNIVHRNADKHDYYFVPRRNFFMGRWIRHSGWYPNYRQPQLFRKGAMVYDNLPVHEGYIALTSKPTGYLQSSIWQFPFKDVGEIMRKADRYSALGAQKILHKKNTPLKALTHGLWSFIRHYILKLGFLDGWPGFVIAFGNFEGTFYRYMRAYELQNQQCLKPESAPVIGRQNSSAHAETSDPT